MKNTNTRQSLGGKGRVIIAVKVSQLVNDKWKK